MEEISIKNKDFKDFLNEENIDGMDFDQNSIVHVNAIEILDNILQKKNFKSLYIEEDFGYGKTEVVKYLKKHKYIFGIGDWNITYIDATVLEIMEDNKIWVLANILDQILNSQSNKNKELSFMLSQLQINIERKTTGTLNITKVLQKIKEILKGENHLIIFDELDRVSVQFARFLIISVGNNIIHHNTKVLWVLSNRGRIFKDSLDEFRKYGEYKINLMNHDVKKIFMNRLDKKVKLDEDALRFIEHKTPRYVEKIADIISSSMDVNYHQTPFIYHLLAAILHDIQHSTKDSKDIFKKYTNNKSTFNNYRKFTLESDCRNKLFANIPKENIDNGNKAETLVFLYDDGSKDPEIIVWDYVRNTMIINGWINE